LPAQDLVSHGGLSNCCERNIGVRLVAQAIHV
jgi:hypothetical protein